MVNSGRLIVHRELALNEILVEPLDGAALARGATAVVYRGRLVDDPGKKTVSGSCVLL